MWCNMLFDRLRGCYVLYHMVDWQCLRTDWQHPAAATALAVVRCAPAIQRARLAELLLVRGGSCIALLLPECSDASG